MSRDQRTRIKHVTVVLTHDEVMALLSKLCIRLGFCLPADKQLFLASAPPEDIDEFTQAVFVAEGLDPTTSERQLYNQVRQVVAHAFVKHQEQTDVELS